MNLLDVLIPKRCVGCGKIGKYFCDRCRAEIRIIPSNEAICPVCEKPAIGGYTHPRCQTRYAPDGLTSFFHYSGPVRKAIKVVKYRLVSDIAEEFIDLIHRGTISEITKPISSELTIIIPIPLHSKRLRDRGFNQAEVLGKMLSTRLHIPMRIDILRRVRETTPQVAMRKRVDRLKNMEGVFGCNAQALTHRRLDAVILFDDVFTTGATMRVAANVLKRNGVKFIWGVTIAR